MLITRAVNTTISLDTVPQFLRIFRSKLVRHSGSPMAGEAAGVSLFPEACTPELGAVLQTLFPRSSS